MTLRLAYNKESFYKKVKELLEKFPTVTLKAYNDEIDKKDAYKLKSYFGTKQSPFMALYDDNDRIVTAFYSEDKSCTIDYLEVVLTHWIVYNPIKYDGDIGIQETA